MGFIKGGWLNVISEWLRFCIWGWPWSHQGRNIRKEWWMWNGGDRNKGGPPSMTWKLCWHLPVSSPPSAMKWSFSGSGRRSNMLDYCPTMWGSRSATDCVDCHSAWGLALPFWAQRIWLLHSRLPNLYKMSHMFHINLKLCKEGYSGKCSFQVS